MENSVVLLFKQYTKYYRSSSDLAERT